MFRLNRLFNLIPQQYRTQARIAVGLLMFVVFVIALVICFVFDGQISKFLADESVRVTSMALTVTAALLGFIRFITDLIRKSKPTTTLTQEQRLLNSVEEWMKLLEGLIDVELFCLITRTLPDQTKKLEPECSVAQAIEQIAVPNKQLSLLILGEPGAGKTTTLLELTRRLIANAKADPDQPIPVVFNLSSWAETQLPLQEWLACELQAKYQIPPEIGTTWVQKHRILPLLDGLDEVQAEARAACVAEINAFLPNTGVTGMVVCCRNEEYKELEKKSQHLNLKVKVELQPLEPKKVIEYVAAGGERLAGLWALLKEDEDMRTLATSPLMLSIMSLAYQDVSVIANPSGDKQAHLFNDYIDKMFSRRPAESQRYPKEKALHCLTWLAKQMQQRGQTVFLVERLQPDWMPSRLGYQLLYGAVFGAFLLVFVFIVKQDLWHSVKVGVFGGFVLGIVSGFAEIETMETLGWSWERFRREGWKQALLWGLGGSLFGGLLVGLVGLFINMAYGPFGGLLVGLLGGLLVGLDGGLHVGLLVGLHGGLQAGLENQIPDKKSVVNQGIVASFHNMLYFGTPFGIIMGVVLWMGMIATGFGKVRVASFLLELFLGVFIGFFVLGGRAVVQHFVLRLILWLAGYTPFNLVHFLDHAANLILLRKVGGGYVFIHRLILEHFATKWLKKS